MIQGALINASKFDGRCWDPGCDQATNARAAEAAARAMQSAGLLTGGYAAAFAVLTPLAMGAFTAPDTFGSAYIFSDGAISEPQKLTRIEDTLTPQWALAWSRVPFNKSTYIQLDLWDADAFNADDPMGRPIINAGHLEAALKAQKTFRIPVADQTNNQVLYIGVHVIPDE